MFFKIFPNPTACLLYELFFPSAWLFKYTVYSWLYVSVYEQGIRASNSLLQIELQASKFLFDQILMSCCYFWLNFHVLALYNAILSHRF